MTRSTTALLPTRDALAELRDVPCALVARGAATGAPPLVTVAIPTFRRAALLVEAVRSVCAQDFDRPFELIITDNDPASTGAAALLNRVPELRDRDFRYYVNGENVGGCHNVNRGIELARAPWVTILHDDDLLEPGFLTASFREIDADPSIDGLVGAKRTFDERAAPGGHTPSAGVRARRLARRLLDELLYAGRSSRRIEPRKLFWGPLMGNIVGFLFRKSCAEQLGGFDPKEEPASDLWFYIRLAQRFHLRQHRAMVAKCRVAVNDSMKPTTIRAMFVQQHALHQTLATGAVPRWWRHLSPYLIARSRVEIQGSWGVDVAAHAAAAKQAVSHLAG
jgi:hypothetical protein